MKNYLLIIMALFVIACADSDSSDSGSNDSSDLETAVNNNSDTTLTRDEKYYFENTRINFGEPISFNSTKNIAVPIILEMKYEEKGLPDHTYFNFAIIDSTNKIKKYLFDSSIVIDNIRTIENEADYSRAYFRYNDMAEEEVSDNYKAIVLFEVANYANRKTGNKRLYAYNLETDQLHLISPPSTDLIDWFIFENQAKVLAEYRIDSNNDGLLDEKDDLNMSIYDFDNPALNSNIFDLEDLKRIKVKVAKKN